MPPKLNKILDGLQRYAAAAIVLLTSVIFATWYAHEQVGALFLGQETSYPLQLRLITITEVIVVFVIFYLLISLWFRWIKGERLEHFDAIIAALVLLPFALAPLGLPTPAIDIPQLASLNNRFGRIITTAKGNGVPILFYVSILAIFLFSVYYLIRSYYQNRPGWRRRIAHIGALALILVGHAVGNQLFSPLMGSDLIYNSIGLYQQEQPFIEPVYQGFAWAKMFSFSAFDYSYWGSAPNVPTLYYSFPLQLLAFLLDLPSISQESFIVTYNTVLFALLVAGGFATYLIVRELMDADYGTSVAAGIAFVLANHSLYENVLSEPQIHIASYSLFPFYIYLMCRAVKSGSLAYAACAGMAISLPFYLASPHPESTILFMLSVIVFTAVLFVWKPRGQSWSDMLAQRSKVGAVAAITCVGVSLAHIVPIFGAELDGTMHVFGHAAQTLTKSWFRPWNSEFVYGFQGLMEVLMMAVAVGLVGMLLRRRLDPLFLSVVAVGSLSFMLIHPGTGAWLFLQIRELGFPINPNAPLRTGMLVEFFAILILAFAFANVYQIFRGIVVWYTQRVDAVGNPLFKMRFLTAASESNRAAAGKTVFASLSVVLMVGLAVAFLALLGTRQLVSGVMAFNPGGCPYYITLQSQYANHLGLKGDLANAAYFRERLVAFERDLIKIKVYDNVTRSEYQKKLKEKFNFSSSEDIPLEQVFSVVAGMAKFVDAFYLSDDACVHPLLYKPLVRKRLVAFNLDGMYFSDPDPFKLVVPATRGEGPYWSSDAHLGLGIGRRLHSSMTTLDNRFMMGQPLIHAIYLIPGHDFASRGYYKMPLTWALKADRVLQRDNRALLGIAGAQAFTFNKLDYPKANDEAAQGMNLDGLTEVGEPLHPKVDGNQIVVSNKSGYDFAYLAEYIFPSDRSAREASEKQIRDYFRNRSSVEEFRATVNRLRNDLLALDKRHSVLSENISATRAAALSVPENSQLARVINIAGPRINVETNCPNEQCLMVLNLAKLPGWKAYLNHTRLDIDLANHGFMSVQVPKGKHSVIFAYMPTAHIFACFITLFFLAGALYSARRL